MTSSDRGQGEPKSTLLERLRAEMGPVLASDLVSHARRGAVVFVAPELDFLSVAVAIARDEAALVRDWIETGRLRSTSPSDIEELESSAEGQYLSVIVRPYVLARKISSQAS